MQVTDIVALFWLYFRSMIGMNFLWNLIWTEKMVSICHQKLIGLFAICTGCIGKILKLFFCFEQNKAAIWSLILSTFHDSVLVHSGGVHGGHYYAFIRPTLSDHWYTTFIEICLDEFLMMDKCIDIT